MANDKGIATTISTNAGNRPVDNFIFIPEATKQGFAVAGDGDGDGDGVYIDRPYQKRGVVQKGMIQTLKTRCADVGVVVGNAPKVLGNYCKGRFSSAQIVDKNFIAPTFMENHGKVMGIVDKTQLRIRKLTPKECFKLMGVKPSDYEKMTISKSQKYKQAGNSIVTTCLMAIYSQLFVDVDYKKKIDELVEELVNGI